MSNMVNTFADLIKAKRAEKNLTRSEMARRVGITPQYAMEIERGSIIPNEDKIEGLIEVLELDERIAFQLADKIPLRVYEKAKEEYFNEE
jgi:transcriptional regulator with XRE-family HTH domain